MDGLFSRRRFTNFGPTRLLASPEPPPTVRVQAATARQLRSCVRAQCSRRPGVYGMVDANGALVYVGKAKSLRTRLLSYFRTASRDAKAGRILESTHGIVWEQAPSEFGALLRELELIRRWQPRFNVHGQPHRRRRTYVCLGRRPAPYVFLSARPPAGALASFGPVPAGGQAQEAVRRLNDGFRLRDCSQAQEMHFAEEAEIFPVTRAAGCLRYEIGTCLGPCVAACSRTAYAAQVRSARTFLEGTGSTLLTDLERDMTAAAAGLQFERATALRDRLDTLRWLHGHLERLRTARLKNSFVYPVGGADGRQLWYLIRRGGVAGVLTPTSDAVEMIATVFGTTEPARPTPLAVDEVDAVLLVDSWFRRHPGERERTMDPTEALALCQAACP